VNGLREFSYVPVDTRNRGHVAEATPEKCPINSLVGCDGFDPANLESFRDFAQSRDGFVEPAPATGFSAAPRGYVFQ
jgi:hypothetical protein